MTLEEPLSPSQAEAAIHTAVSGATRPRSLLLGAARSLQGSLLGHSVLPAHHLVTHGVVVGMTGSGKTGLLTVMLEEALRSHVPSLIIDVKGDLPNLLLNFPSFAAEHFEPWASSAASPSDPRSTEEIALALAHERREQLTPWDITEETLQDYARTTDIRVITPGSTAGEPLHILSAFTRHDNTWEEDPETALTSLSASVSLLLRLVGRDPDPTKSKDHVLISILAERRLRAGKDADLRALMRDLESPPIEEVGALPLDSYYSPKQRAQLAASLNTLLASPTFSAWRTGIPLNIGDWLTPKDNKTPAVILSVAHLDDDERALVLGVVLEELLSWVRSLSGSRRLKTLLAFDEVYGFMPPHPKNPPTKGPLVALLKQARAFGVGVLLATQNPMDLDYRALSNAGLWCIGRLQTDADRARVLEGLASATANGRTSAELGAIVKHLPPRYFLLRNAHSDRGPHLLHPRFAMSFLRGPMTRAEIRRAREGWEGTSTMARP